MNSCFTVVERVARRDHGETMHYTKRVTRQDHDKILYELLTSPGSNFTDGGGVRLRDETRAFARLLPPTKVPSNDFCLDAIRGGSNQKPCTQSTITNPQSKALHPLTLARRPVEIWIRMTNDNGR